MTARLWWVLLVVATAPIAGVAADSFVAHPVPPEFTAGRHERYAVTVNGEPVMLFHATPNIYFASFDFTGQANVKVAATDSNYWQGVAVVRPRSRGIMPKVDGQTVSFTLTRPGQFSIERLGMGRFDDEVLFLFANPPDQDIPRANDPAVLWLGPGIHQQNVDLVSGQTLYLAPGAVLFGSVNVWNADNVRICGRGTVVYCGPQSPDFNTGWFHARNWHPLTTHEVRGFTVEGVTFVGLSRTFALQLYATTAATFDNIKIIAANPANVNSDGMDWYDGGEATVRDSFIRSGDDCFAFFTGPSPNAMAMINHSPYNQPAGEVAGITIERCILWPSYANVIRTGADNQALVTHHIILRDCDVIHNHRHQWMGASDALLTAVATNGQGDARHDDYLFENIRFEDPIAILGINQPSAQFSQIRFRNLRFAGGLANGLLQASVDGMSFENVRVGDSPAGNPADLNLTVGDAAQNLRFLPTAK